MVNVNKIKALATEQGRSLAYLCSKMGVAKVYFNDIQKHGRDIPDNRLQTIADILNTTPEYLRDETDIKEKPAAKSEKLLVNINKIKTLAKEKGLKLKYICAEIGVSETYLGNVKSGKDRMTEQRLEKIADILNTTPEYLRDETDIKEKPSAKSEELLKTNTVHVVGRDGTNITKTLTDEQIRMLQTMIDALPEADDL